MGIVNKIRELLELRYEFKERKNKCESCDTLRLQLEIVNHEKALLLNRLLEKPEPVVQPIRSDEMKVIQPKNVPWNTRRQMLETEDREKAKLMRVAPKPSNVEKIEDLEKELLDAPEASTSKA